MTQDLWEREYQLHRISSSTNLRPSHGVEFLRDGIARFMTFPVPSRLLDLGCGSGRNADLLARAGFEVWGMDFAHRPLATGSARPGGGRCRFVQASMASPLPFGSGVFTVVAAFTSLENLVDNAQLRALGQEIRRVLQPHGLLYAYFLTAQDGYYQPLIRRAADGRRLTFDPVTGLRQRVYSTTELDELFGPSFQLLDSQDFAFKDTRSGKTFDRHLAAALWRYVGSEIPGSACCHG